MPEQSEKQLPLKRAESAAVFVLVVQAAAGGVALLLSWLSRSAAANAAGMQLLAGVLVWVAALVHQRLRRLAAEEALAAESLKLSVPGQPDAALFRPDGTDLLTARNRVAQFERYFLPASSGVIAVVLGVLAYSLLRGLAAAGAPAPLEEPLRNFWVFAGIAFVSYLLAKYTAGLATQAPWRPLRPGASYLMSCALGSLLVAVSFVFSYFEYPVVERVVAWVIPVAMAVLSAETLLLLVMSLYRPRAYGEERRPAHDSRLLGMLTTSRGILRTTAETLDYQFGFKVSETWFYRFMERALGPLILFQAITLSLLTCFVIVNTGERAIIERFGKPRASRETLGPGLHLKWPWPIEICYRYPVERVEVLAIGEQLEEDAPGYLWTKVHAKAAYFLLVANRQQAELGPKEGQAPAAPQGAPNAPARLRPERSAPGVSMLSGTVLVFYRVKDLYDYLYNQQDPKDALESLCYRELSRYGASADFMELLGYGRGDAMAVLRERIQKSADRLGLGVEITNVMLQGIHPPVEVAGAFESVVSALEEKEARVWGAKTYEKSLLPRAMATAERLRAEAAIYAYARQYLAPAEAEQFLMLVEASNEAPSVFRHRKLLSALEEALADARKVVTPDWAKTREVINLDLEDKLVPNFGSELDLSGTQ